MSDAVTSYTAADSIPYKLLQDVSLVKYIVERKNIPPSHIQFIPTNVCNLECPFCSCSKDDHSLTMPLQEMVRVVDLFAKAGTEGMTITGGGEPLMYPYMQNLIEFAYWRGIKTGLVTNGTLLRSKDAHWLNSLSWCRVSYGDDRENMSDSYVDDLHNLVKLARHTGWAFSYVVSKQPNMDRMKRTIALASSLKMTHVRFVADLLNPDEVPMEEVQSQLSEYTKSFKTPVIFQARNHPEKGADCYICYLKPVVSPDSKVYACCGVQYALPEPSKKLPDELCLGTVDQFVTNRTFQPFKGAKRCVTCYYGGYNRMLKGLLADIDHKEFV